jgi:hypothetical protein
MAARHELDRHVCDDVPALAKIAQHTRTGDGPFHVAIGFEETVMCFENAVFGLIPALRRERRVIPSIAARPA